MKIKIKCFDDNHYNFLISNEKEAFAVWTLYESIQGNKALWKTDGIPELLDSVSYFLDENFKIQESLSGNGFWQHYKNFV